MAEVGLAFGLDSLVALYTLRQPAAIRDYLGEHPFLLPLLIEAKPHLEHHFGPVRAEVELLTDPETPESQELFLVVCSPASMEDARARLQALDDSWWLEASVVRGRNRMNTDVDPEAAR